MGATVGNGDGSSSQSLVMWSILAPRAANEAKELHDLFHDPVLTQHKGIAILIAMEGRSCSH